jgi:hypothetical protein
MGESQRDARPTTVSRWTMATAERQSLQKRDNQTHSKQSQGLSFDRFLAER